MTLSASSSAAMSVIRAESSIEGPDVVPAKEE